MKNRGSYLHFAPRGVVGVISPWNFPFGIATGEIVMALLAGNAVVHKPSEMTPLIALKTKELFDASGMPADLFQVVTGRGAGGRGADRQRHRLLRVHRLDGDRQEGRARPAASG